MLINKRGAKFMKPAPRSGSAVSTCDKVTRCLPSHKLSPGCNSSASNKPGSAHACPGAGMVRTFTEGPS